MEKRMPSVLEPGMAPVVEHASLFRQAMRFVEMKTGLTLRIAERRASDPRLQIVTSLARAMLELVRRESPDGRSSSNMPPFDDAFSRALFNMFQSDSEACWLVTDALVHKILHRKFGISGKAQTTTTNHEKLRLAAEKALGELEFGRYPLLKYQEKITQGDHDAGLTFWKYYYEAIEKKTVSGLRFPRRNLLLTLSRSLDADIDDEPPIQLSSSQRSCEQVLSSLERGENRRRIVDEVRRLALDGALPGNRDGKSVKPDPNCEIVLQYIDWWLAQKDEDRSSSQSDFAKSVGINSNTIASAFLRFRKKHGFDDRGHYRYEIEVYTTAGGNAE